MTRATRQQLDEVALRLLRERRDVLGSITAVGKELEITRTAVSQALNGKYPANTHKLRARIMRRYADRIACPHLHRDIAPDECVSFRERPLPSGPRTAIDHWCACRACPENPLRRPEAAEIAGGDA
jgi:hypothetical protein